MNCGQRKKTPGKSNIRCPRQGNLLKSCPGGNPGEGASPRQGSAARKAGWTLPAAAGGQGLPQEPGTRVREPRTGETPLGRERSETEGNVQSETLLWAKKEKDAFSRA